MKHCNKFKIEVKQANTNYVYSPSHHKPDYANSDKHMSDLDTISAYDNKQHIKKKRIILAPLNKVINVQKPKYTEYAVLATRINSFDDNWPKELELNPITMAEAGYYYTGQNDFVRCFFCGGGLESWHTGDDPWKKHARYELLLLQYRSNIARPFGNIHKRV